MKLSTASNLIVPIAAATTLMACGVHKGAPMPTQSNCSEAIPSALPEEALEIDFMKNCRVDTTSPSASPVVVCTTDTGKQVRIVMPASEKTDANEVDTTDDTTYQMRD